MFEQLHVFFSQISLFNSFFLNVLRAQCLYCTEPRACGSKLLISGELACCSSQMPLMGCILGAPGLHSAPLPFISQFVEISRCTKACKFKICFEENGVAFFFVLPWNELFLWASLPARLLGRIFAEMECKSGTNAAKLNTFTDVKGSGFCRLVNLFGVRTVSRCGFMEFCVTGP